MNNKIFDYIQHLSKQDKKSLSEKVLKCTEELGELAKVALPYDNAFATNHRFSTRENILEESVDLILCALSVAYDQEFTHDEIETMMSRKAEKWQGLQASEQNLKYPIPFEIHVTVKLNPDTQSIIEFKNACASLNVKPILLDLHTKNEMIKDLMTSSKHFGTNASAYVESERISRTLESWGWDVIRVKIETVPWHPASPKQTNNLKMPPDCYFEAHIPVKVKNQEHLDLLKNHLNGMSLHKTVHVSNNAFKSFVDGSMIVMLTYRSTFDVQESFEWYVESIIGWINDFEKLDNKFEVGKVHKEFSIYDTKMSHDAKWLMKE